MSWWNIGYTGPNKSTKKPIPTSERPSDRGSLPLNLKRRLEETFGVAKPLPPVGSVPPPPPEPPKNKTYSNILPEINLNIPMPVGVKPSRDSPEVFMEKIEVMQNVLDEIRKEAIEEFKDALIEKIQKRSENTETGEWDQNQIYQWAYENVIEVIEDEYSKQRG